MISLKKKFSDIKAEIGHLKLIATTGNSSLQGNITALDSKEELKGDLEKASEWLLIINARIRLKPEKLKDVVLEPPYLIRE